MSAGLLLDISPPLSFSLMLPVVMETSSTIYSGTSLRYLKSKLTGTRFFFLSQHAESQTDVFIYSYL